MPGVRHEILGPQHVQLSDETVGRGSFGDVLRATRTPGTPDSLLPDGNLAVKVLDLEEADEELHEIHAEIRFMSNCRHANCVTFYGSYVEGNLLYIVMEFLGAGSLHSQLKAGTLPEDLIAIICREALQGLEYLHAGRWVHRDIKAANILLGEGGEVKLADFGVSATLINVGKRRSIVGSPYWMPPEIITCSGTTETADIWSLGVTCLELTRGLPPYADINPMQAMARITKGDPVKLEDSYSEPFRDFVARCLRKNPDKRPSATELLQHKFVTEAGPRSDLQVLPERLAKWKAERAGTSKDSAPVPTPSRVKSVVSGELDLVWEFETARLTPAEAIFRRNDITMDNATEFAEVFGIPGDEPLSLVDYAAARWTHARPEIKADFESFLDHLEFLCKD